MDKFKVLSRPGGTQDVMNGNTRSGYVDESGSLFGIDGKGYANEIGPINHRTEIIGKLIEWRTQQGIG
jgi:hypothetical protein